jgi:hypothetical protein
MIRISLLVMLMAPAAFAIDMAETAHNSTTCTGNSTGLAPVECAAWQELYDSSNGAKWEDCSKSRSDPCSCARAYGRGCTCINGHISRIDLGANRLSGPITSSLGKLSMLTFLDLAGNSLSEPITSSLGQLSMLTNLDLSHNSLSGSIPSSLGQLSMMTSLILVGNKLTGLVPALPFNQYDGACRLDAGSGYGTCTEPNCNHFKCPLPYSAKYCYSPTYIGVHCK